jgi:hypothetical protein
MVKSFQIKASIIYIYGLDATDVCVLASSQSVSKVEFSLVMDRPFMIGKI